jgi:hypothetical protein
MNDFSNFFSNTFFHVRYKYKTQALGFGYNTVRAVMGCFQRQF